MTHRSTQQLLYDYLREELDPVQRRQVEDHVASCKRCAEELTELRSAFESVPPHGFDATRERNDEFWNSFASSVENRIRHEGARANHVKMPARWQALITAVSAHPRFMPALGSVLAVIVIAVLAWQLRSPVKPETEQAAILQPILENAPDRLAEYFRKSKVLLVGLTNLKPPESEPLDLSVERQRSEELLLVSREIARDSLDTYSAMVVNDLEKVLAEIAVAQSVNEHKRVESLRKAIRQQNLIFKLRMIEKMHVPPRIVKARDDVR